MIKRLQDTGAVVVVAIASLKTGANKSGESVTHGAIYLSEQRGRLGVNGAGKGTR